jgi:hypothetical protein
VKKEIMSLFAAFLNAFFWGSGYLYAGRRRVFGVLLFVGFLLVHAYWFTVGFTLIWTSLLGALAILGHLVISLGLAYDVYSES